MTNIKQTKTKYSILKLILQLKKCLMKSKYFNNNIPDTSDQSLEIVTRMAAAFCLENDIKVEHFNSLFRYQLVDALKAADPQIQIIQIAVRTGVDRRLISNMKVNPRQTRDLLVLSYIKSYCQKHQTSYIRKKGPFESFDYFCRIGANGTLTTNAIAYELMRLGHIQDKGRRYKIVFETKN